MPHNVLSGTEDIFLLYKQKFWQPLSIMLEGPARCKMTSHQHGSVLSTHSSWAHLCSVSSVQPLSRVRLFATPWITARQASLSITNSQSSLRLTSIKSVMPSSHLILCHPLLLLPSIPPNIRVFSNVKWAQIERWQYIRFQRHQERSQVRIASITLSMCFRPSAEGLLTSQSVFLFVIIQYFNVGAQIPVSVH